MKSFAILFAILISSSAYGADKKPKAPAPKQAEVDPGKAREEVRIDDAKAVVRNALTDPDSANFRDVYLTPKGVIVCGQVNAKNRYGGYVGFRRFISVGSSVYFDDPDNSFVANNWVKECIEPMTKN
jgi:hypothetical protein